MASAGTRGKLEPGSDIAMDFVSDPPISIKIQKMKQRVRWRDPLIAGRGIDQTRMVIDDGWADNPEFSFLVMGDTGAGADWEHNPQRQIANQMSAHRDSCRFVLHTGDVIYLVGSSEYYLENFIKPYQEFLVGNEPERIAYDQMVFNLPFLPVPGNHDYYDLLPFYGLITGTTLPLRRLLRFRLDFNVGWHGSSQGKVYAQAFLDCLNTLKRKELGHHLDRYYTSKTDTGRCLGYEPGHFTRLPNRYYTFRYGGIDFFALDSNTFVAPPPLPATREGDARRRLLEDRRDEQEREKSQILETIANLDPNLPDDAEQLDDLHAKLQQIDEVKIDINKQLKNSRQPSTIDLEQLDWLQQKLIESWHTASVRGRVIYLHHPPYVTEATKWYQAQTLTIRRYLRQVLDAVAEAVGSLPEGRPLVDLILSGHAHCLEYIRTQDTGHADSHLNWIICGGSGYSLRRQRQEGPELTDFEDAAGDPTRLVARSLLFVGRSGQGLKKRRPYSFLRIDVQDGRPPKFTIRPFVSERFQHQWSNYAIEPFVI